LGALGTTIHRITLESLNPSYGDTYALNITLIDINDSTLNRDQFNSTLGDFDYQTAIKEADVEIIFSKKPEGIFAAKRPRIVERASFKALSIYRRI